MAGINGDITACGLNRTGAVNNFSVCLPDCILLHPEAVIRKNIAVYVVDTCSKQRDIIARINQPRIQQRTGGRHRQTARCTGETVDGDIFT